MPSREQYIAIGDIHGCPEQLEEILESASAFPDHRLVFLGDYIDRGPDSEAVIRRIRDLDAVFILGNHESMLLRHIANEFSVLPDVFENSRANVRLSRSSLEWIRDVPLPIYETEDYIFTHAGLNPHLALQDQDEMDYYWTLPVGDYLHLTSRYVIHGHVVCPEPELEGNRINVNTGCGAGGRLAAVVLPELQFLMSSASAEARTVDMTGRQDRFAGELAELEALFADPDSMEDPIFHRDPRGDDLEELEVLD